MPSLQPLCTAVGSWRQTEIQAIRIRRCIFCPRSDRAEVIALIDRLHGNWTRTLGAKPQRQTILLHVCARIAQVFEYNQRNPIRSYAEAFGLRLFSSVVQAFIANVVNDPMASATFISHIHAVEPANLHSALKRLHANKNYGLKPVNP